MKDDNIEHINCPYCKSDVEVNVRWAKKNGRVFCNACCKSFDLRIEEDEEPNEKVTKSEKDGFNYW